MRILIAGYYGYGNLGDELILSSLVSQLKLRFPSSDLHVLSSQPLSTEQLHGIKSHHRWNPWTVWCEMWQTDLFVLGGGGLLQDTTSSRSLLYYLALIWLARLAACRIALFAIGVERLSRKWIRPLVRTTLRSPSITITVRDWESKALLVEVGVESNRIHVTGDPAFLSPKVATPTNRFTPTSNKVLLVPRFPCPSRGDELFKRIVGLIRERKQMEISGALFSPQQEEVKFLRSALAEVLKPEEVLMSESPAVVVKEMSKVDYVISTRFHGLVMAAVLGRPFMGVGDEEKVGRFCRAWGQPFIPWHADQERIDLELADLFRGRIDQQSDQLPVWRARALQTVDHLVSGLDS